MKTIPKKKKTELLDISFVEDYSLLYEKYANLRSMETVEALMKSLFALKYSNAKTTFR